VDRTRQSVAWWGHPFSQPWLTATVTATAAANGKRQRSAAPRDTRTLPGHWGYVRPEKRKVDGPISPDHRFDQRKR
jgi:hypothetical protein